MNIIGFILSLLVPTIAFANDSAVSDFAGQMHFMKEENISIQKEVLEFFPQKYQANEGRMAAPIKVSYLMKNESDKAKKIDIAFPLPVSDLYRLKTSFTSYPNHILPTMKLFVDGKSVSGKWEQVIECNGKRALADKTPEDLPEFDNDEFCENPPKERNSQNLKSQCTEAQIATCKQLKNETGIGSCADAINTCKVSRAYRWSYEFPTNKVVRVVHEYTSSRGIASIISPEGVGKSDLFSSEKIMGLKDPKDIFCLRDMGSLWYQKIDPKVYFWNEYTLIPGGNWKGPIRHFEMIIHRADNEIISTCFPNLKKTSKKEFRSTIKDFTPTGDIIIGYLKPKMAKAK